MTGMSYHSEKHEKGVKVTMGVDEMRMKQGMGEMIMMDFDSNNENEGNNPIAGALKPVLEAEFFAILDEDGKLLEFGGGEEEAGQADALGLGEENFKQVFQSSQQMMPTAPVVVGESWKAHQEFPMGQLGESVTITLECKLEGMEELDGRKVAKISFKHIETKEEEETDAPLTLKIEKYEGLLWHDPVEFVSWKSEASIKLLMSVPGGEGAIQENGLGEIPYSMDVVTTLKEVKK